MGESMEWIQNYSYMVEGIMWHIDFSPEQNYFDHQTGKKNKNIAILKQSQESISTETLKKKEIAGWWKMTVGEKNKK